MSLHHVVVGAGGHDVVFLHGLFGQGKNWATIARRISDVATSHLLDLPNHGASDWTDDFTLDGQADIVAKWLANHLQNPVALVGHSLGGKLAMRLAVNHPELVDRLMIVDISPAKNEAASEFAPLVAALRGLDLERLESRAAADAALKDAIPNPVVRGFLLQNLRGAAGSWHLACNLKLLGDSLPEIGGWPALSGTFPGPVAWVAGGRSPYVLPEHREAMRALFPRTVAIVLKSVGHWVHSEDPEAFTAVTRRFLADPDWTS